MIGWVVDSSDADNYFLTERLETDCWDALLSSGSGSGSGTPTLKEKVLLNAYNRIYYSGKYILIPSSPTPSQLVPLRKAQCEMAYYLCVHLRDEDRRKGLQAQGVKEAGIVKEKYDEAFLMTLPIPQFVDAILAEFKSARPFYSTDIDRSEDELTSHKDFEDEDY